MKTPVFAVLLALVCLGQAWPKLKRREFSDEDINKALRFCESNGYTEEECKEGMRQCGEEGKFDFMDCAEKHYKEGVPFPDIEKALITCKIFGASVEECFEGMEECASKDRVDFLSCADYHLVVDEDCKARSNGKFPDCKALIDAINNEADTAFFACKVFGFDQKTCSEGIHECVESADVKEPSFAACAEYHAEKKCKDKGCDYDFQELAQHMEFGKKECADIKSRDRPCFEKFRDCLKQEMSEDECRGHLSSGIGGNGQVASKRNWKEWLALYRKRK